MQGIAIGRMGMSREDFLLLTPAEFSEAAERWNAMEEARERNEWLRVRRLAAILIRPHVKHAIPEEKLIPLPGDKPQEREIDESRVTPDEVSARRMEAFRVRLESSD